MTQLDLFPHVVVYSPNGMVIVRFARPGEKPCAMCHELLTPKRSCCVRCFARPDVKEQINEGASK